MKRQSDVEMFARKLLCTIAELSQAVRDLTASIHEFKMVAGVGKLNVTPDEASCSNKGYGE